MSDELPAPRTWIEIDLEALRANARFVKSRIGPSAGLMAVVKANAYGHGVDVVVPALRDLAASFAVANADEAAEVRAFAGSGPDILLMSPCLPDERSGVVRDGWIPVISGEAEARAFAELARAAGTRTRIHLKFDTGMGRIGVWHEEAETVVRAIAGMPELTVHSISTHLPSPDDDADFTGQQLAGFASLVERVRLILPDVKVHVLNSAGTLGFSDDSYDLVRAGLMLYGSSPLPDHQSALRPVMTWRSRVGLVRDVPAGRTVSYGRTYVTPQAMRLATVAVGYADGYPRQASNNGACVLIGGRRCPILGRITMDQIVVAADKAEAGDEVVLLGEQGGEGILAAELAGWAGTIAWDILTGVRGRTVRPAGFPRRNK